MRTTFAQRLAQAAESAGLKEHGRSTAIAKAMGVSTKAVSNWFSGKAEPDQSRLGELSDFLDVNLYWLTGHSDEISKTSEKKIKSGMHNILGVAMNAPFGPIAGILGGIIATKKHRENEIPNKESWESVVTWDSETPLDSEEVEVPFLKDIELACGDGSHDYGDYNGFKLRFSKATLRKFGAPTDGSTIFCFPAKGDSMEPIIPEGSTVTVNIADKQIVDGKVYAINQDGWKRLKLLYRTGPNKVSIRSYNQTYEPEEANLDEIEIIGRAVHFSVML
ncbi:XRE family transcriptional regulator [Thorsellia kenyensis]|uniref:XRE family transcriptional regulator n=1 Tax=Thorsellia kenyensis TaxID=1549888 RepID=A0ABV6C7N3_9GAMM